VLPQALTLGGDKPRSYVALLTFETVFGHLSPINDEKSKT